MRALEFRTSGAAGAPAALPPGGKVICVGLNYASHALELGRPLPEHPPVFLRSWDSLVFHGEDLRMPQVAASYDFEGEIAAVIGKPAWQVRREDALHHVAGYTCFMDGSVREYQLHSIGAGKNFLASGAIGPWIVPAHELPPGGPPRICTRINGVVVQDAPTSEMAADVADLLAYCSRWTRLEPGDVIATGTPAGIGSRRKPPLWLKPGDVVEVEAAGVGVLRNTVATP